MPHTLNDNEWVVLRRFLAGRFLSTIGGQMLSIAVGWQVYSATHRAFDLGMVGLMGFLPSVGLSLVAGQVADRFDRKRVLELALWAELICALLFWWLSTRSSFSLALIYSLIFALGASHAFLGAAGQALFPSLVAEERFSVAAAWNSSAWQVASIAGPALGGLIYGIRGGPAPVYAACAVSNLLGVIFISRIRARPHAREQGPVTWHTLLGGIRYVWKTKMILGAISMDLFAVLLGGATALLPAYASDILRVGPTGLGILRSAPGVGAAAMGFFLAVRPLKKNAGRWMYVCVALFGLFTIAFGLSRDFYFSLFCLTLMGAVDLVSVVIRHTLVQLLTPAQMRGRVSAVNLVFIGASNELGGFESGLTASWWGVVPSVVIGGIGTCVVVALWAFLFPGLRNLDRITSGNSTSE